MNANSEKSATSEPSLSAHLDDKEDHILPKTKKAKKTVPGRDFAEFISLIKDGEEKQQKEREEQRAFEREQREEDRRAQQENLKTLVDGLLNIAKK